MKQKLHQILGALIGLSATSMTKTGLRPVFLFDGNGAKPMVKTPGKWNGNRFIPLLFLSVLLFSSPAMAQTITGNTSVCAGASTALGITGDAGTWSSSNTAIATVDPASGVVGGVAAGTATISCAVAGGEITVTFTVNGVPDPGTITGLNAVCIGSSITLSDNVAGGTWSAQNAILSVNSTTGAVTGNALGSANIIYTVTNSCGPAMASMNIQVNGLIGNIYTFAGTGTNGFNGDGGPAFMANTGDPRDLFVEPVSGTLYFCEPDSNRVRKITRSGIITTVAGNGIAGNSGDGGQATAASLNAVNGVFVDNAGNIFLSNTGAATIRKINTSGIISTIAGTGVFGSTGDGGQATVARISFPLGILEDASGNVYIADEANSNVRKISPSGIITTVVGSSSGTAGYSGDGGQATAALLNEERGLTMDNSGNIYIADASNNVIRKYVPATGIITTIAGTGSAGHTGDNGPATSATLTTPARFAYDGANILYLSDQANNVIREINLGTGIISQVAGNATAGDNANNVSALSAELHTPAGIAVDHFGNFYIADAANNKIRGVPSTGSLSASVVGPSTVCAGTPVSFSAFLSSSGSPTYQWQKNGVNVGSGGPTYTNSAPANGDVYRCIVTVTPVCSPVFMDTSNNIPIVVIHPASSITVPSTIYVGQSAQLGETVTGGTWTSSSPAIATVDQNGILYGLSAGMSAVSYTVTNICGTTSANITVAINIPDTINASTGINGTISPSGPVVVDGGDQTFTFTPDAGYHITDVSVDGVSQGPITSYTFSSVSAGHTISVTFAPDCIAPAITSCPANVIMNNDAGSCGAIAAYATATASGTSPAITYSQAAGTSFPVGVTMVTVNAISSCGTATCSFSVTVNDNQAPTITAPANVTVNGYCTSAAASLGTPTTADNCAVANVTNDAPSLFPVGTTTVHWTVTDVHGNTATAVQLVTVNPGTVTASASVTEVSCNGGNNGGIITTMTGGTSPYTYSWSNDGGTTANKSALTAGTYSVTVTDANGCSATGAYPVTQPASPLSVSGTPTNVNCNGGNTGSISTTVTGGTSSYTYSWSNGATTPGVSNVAANTYSVTVTDANSCTATGAYIITQPASALTVTGTPANAGCNGANTGSIATTASGGTPSYTYLWNTGATTASLSGSAAGTYSVTVTDAHSCTAKGAYTITQPAAITVGGTVTNVSCNGSTNGAITTSCSGGNSPYTYAWSCGGATSSISAKAAATYTVTVTDAHSCTSKGIFTITQPAAVTSAITGDSSVLAGITGAFTAPTGSGCSYSWSVSGSGASISGASTTSSASILSPCTATSYSVSLTVTQGGCSSTCHRTISVLASATITVYGALYTTSTGHYPTVSKTPLPCSLKVYDRHICGPQDGVQSHYSNVWNNTTGLITNCAIGAPVSVNIGGGPAYQYTITVPANGHYLVIGQSTVSGSSYGVSNCTLYTAQKAGDYDVVDGFDYTNDYPLTPCSAPQTVYHCGLQDNTGKCQEGCTQEEHGSLLLIVSPTAIVFDDSVENVPVIYESVIGDWSASVSATPPDGFYAIPADSLSTSVTDSNINAVQFYIADTGSVWTNTDLTHTLYHKGAYRTVHSHPKMINNRTNKLSSISIQPNPAKDVIRMVFPKFEGKATVRVYNMLGQKMIEQPIGIYDGASVSMDISKLVPGVYLVSAENGSNRVTARLMKQ